MARIRTIRPEIWESQKVGSLGVLARLNFIGLISLADDEGRGRGSPEYIKARLHPYTEIANELIAETLDEIQMIGLARFYQVAGSEYYDLPGWKEHQKIDHPAKSRIPQFVEGSRVLARISRGLAVGREGKGREGKGEEGICIAPSAATQNIPRKISSVQKIVNAYKISKGVPKDDKGWDRANYSKSLRYAKSILEAFNGSVDAAIAFVIVQGEEYTKAGLDSWTLSSIQTQAWNKAHTLVGGKNVGRTQEQVGRDVSGEPRRLERLTQDGEGVQDEV